MARQPKLLRNNFCNNGHDITDKAKTIGVCVTGGVTVYRCLACARDSIRKVQQRRRDSRPYESLTPREKAFRDNRTARFNDKRKYDLLRIIETRPDLLDELLAYATVRANQSTPIQQSSITNP